MQYRGYGIHNMGLWFCVMKLTDYDYEQEPFASIALAKAAIDRHLDFGVPFHQGC